MNWGKIVGLQTESAELDSRSNNRIWLIVYVRTHVPPAQYCYSGPPPYGLESYHPLMEGLALSGESQRFRFGRWEVKIAVTCDSGEKLERTEHFHAE
jgi:hypothetical protein